MSPDERRAEIVRAADGVFEGRDPATVTFEEIAAAAGVSRALVYNYFGDKGGLMAAVYRAALSGLDDELWAALAGPGSPRHRLHLVVERYVRFARDHVEGWHTLGVVAATQHPAVQRARSERFERLSAAWGDSADARVVVAGLMGLLEAVVMDWLDHPTLDAESLVKLIEELLWSGVEPLVQGPPTSTAAALGVVTLSGDCSEPGGAASISG